MKKNIQVILGLLLAISMIIGTGACSPASTTAAVAPTATQAAAQAATTAPKGIDYANMAPITITWLGWTSQIPKLKLRVEDFQKQYPDMAKKVTFNLVDGGKGPNDVLAKVRLMLVSGEAMPDIVDTNWAQLPEYGEMKNPDGASTIWDLSSVIGPLEKDINPGIVSLMKYKGKFIGFPGEIKAKVWFYRKDMFAAAGVDPAKVKTMDDLIAAGKALQTKYPKTFIENYSNVPPSYDFNMVLSGNGGSLIDKDGNYIADTDPGVKAAFQFFGTLRQSGVVSSTIVDFAPEWYAALGDGTVSSQLIGAWFYATLFTMVPDTKQKWGAALWPEFNQSGSESGAMLFMIPSASKNKAVVADVFTKLTLDKDFETYEYKAPINIFPFRTDLQADPAFLSGSDYFGPDLPTTFFQAMKVLKVVNYNPKSALEETITNQHLGDYLSGAKTLDQALKELQNDLKTQIGNAYK